MSENVFQSKLDIARGIGLAPDLSERRRCVDIGRRRTENHAIKDIEKLGTELKPVSLIDPDVLKHAEILIKECEGSDIG